MCIDINHIYTYGERERFELIVSCMQKSEDSLFRKVEYLKPSENGVLSSNGLKISKFMGSTNQSLTLKEPISCGLWVKKEYIFSVNLLFK